MKLSRQRPRSKWSVEAKCAGDVRFLSPNKTSEDIKVCKSVCNSCPVEEECKNYAIVHEEHLIYGGMDAGERSRIRYRERAALTRKAAVEGWLEDLSIIMGNPRAFILRGLNLD